MGRWQIDHLRRPPPECCRSGRMPRTAGADNGVIIRDRVNTNLPDGQYALITLFSRNHVTKWPNLQRMGAFRPSITLSRRNDGLTMRAR